MENAVQIIFQIGILIFSVVIHEVSHGYTALMLGDRTAYYAGRLTLNPIKHLDPVGSLIVPAAAILLGGFIIGWAKPVPFDPYNLRNQKWGPAIVGAAGPGSNFLLAFVFGIIGMVLPLSAALKQELLFGFFRSGLGFGGLPAAATSLEVFYVITLFIVWINIVLMIFNLVPIPPLDGSKVLFAILPYEWRSVQYFLEQYGIFLLIFVIFYLFRFLLPLMIFLFQLLTGF